MKDNAALGGPGKQLYKRESEFRSAISRLSHRPEAVISGCVFLVIILIGIFADLIADYDTKAIAQDITNALQSPNVEHWFGTDQYGRDLFARIIHGVRTALLMGVCASLLSLFISTILACCCAYFGGIVDMIIMRIMDALSSIPPIILALAVCASLGNGLGQLIFALGFGSISVHTRMIRSAALSVAKQDYVESAVALGAGTIRIILKYLIPNIISMIIIQFSGNIAINIMMGATLSFIGLEVKVPRPEWGIMLSEGMSYMRMYPFMIIVPACALIITAVAINTFGDCLRDALDPELKGKA